LLHQVGIAQELEREGHLGEAQHHLHTVEPAAAPGQGVEPTGEEGEQRERKGESHTETTKACGQLPSASIGEVSAPASKEPRMGPVQLKETSARVRAMKKMPMSPPNFEAFWSMLFTQLLGRVISK
jgi:hypothetical protein